MMTRCTGGRVLVRFTDGTQISVCVGVSRLSSSMCNEDRPTHDLDSPRLSRGQLRTVLFIEILLEADEYLADSSAGRVTA